MGGERLAARDRIWDDLPAEQRGLRHQWLGWMSSGCAATHGVHEGCDFSCTACYLDREANRAEPLPFDAVRRQLDAIRRRMGPLGNVQITAGEVTLLPRERLIRIVRYAQDIGLDPMVMTHGDIFRRDPTYLHSLMLEGGLQKIGVHIDSTQRGRFGVPRPRDERDLMPIREEFAHMIRDARRVTGKPLHAAHTMTVTESNLQELPAVMDWLAQNVDAFRMISLQPVSAVGRTREVGARPEPDRVWTAMREGLGADLNPHTFLFGHPSCNSVGLAFVCRFGDDRRVVEVKREGRRLDARFFDALGAGAFRGFNPDTHAATELAARALRLFVDSPGYAWQWPAYALYRLWDHRDLPSLLVRSLLAREPCSVHPLIVVMHNFMNRGELNTDEGRARLAACAFRLPVGDAMVPMCEMNATGLRRANYVQLRT